MTTKVYYPFLGDKNIIDLKQLQQNKLELLEQNKNLLNTTFTKQTENIDMFHEIYNTRKTELKYIEQGIQTVEFVLSQESEYNIPLEIIFKLIHANKDIPFIKYNPSKNQEKIYRLYCDKVAKNGKKIPYLSKNVIFKLAKTLNTTKRVSCYIEYKDDNKIIPIIVSFDSYGNIYIKIEFKETKSIPDIENIINTAVNPVIKIVQTYILTSGYIMNLFNNLYDKNVEIINIKYFSYISINKNINLNNLLGCVSSVFNVIIGELKKGIIMRYKRVSNFNEMDSQEAFIVELLNRYTDEGDITKLLMDNFQLSKTNAQLKIAELLNNLQVIQSLNKTRKMKIKNNPGFLTKITQDSFKQNIMIEMDNINNIFYMNVIPIYIDSLIRITQVPETSNVQISTINNLCKTTTINERKEIEDIIAPSEKELAENKPTAIINQNITIGEDAALVKEKTVNVLDFFGDDSDDDDSDDDDSDDDEKTHIGGNDTNDDEKITTLNKTKKPVKLLIQNDDIIEKNVTNMSMTPNPFFKAMKEKDPILFLDRPDGKYKAYSRSCPWNKRRQPVILTDEEKEVIDKEHPGSYEHAIKYGSDPNKQYWYICPRYWDLKNNTSLTEEEVKSGKYGKLIPQQAKTVPPGANIWEFSDAEGAHPINHIDKNGNYITHNPGFLDEDAHPDGLCVPCCFKSWDTPKQIQRRKECNQDKDIVQNKSQDATTKQEVDEYIKGPDKFPLKEGKFGYLPSIVQMFIQTDNKKCQISNTNKNLKKLQPCYLRKGVENSKYKSFIACISDIYSEENKNIVLTIENFITQKLIKILTPDKFVFIQNGSLVSEFASSDLDDINIDEIKDSEVYLKLKSFNPIQLKKNS